MPKKRIKSPECERGETLIFCISLMLVFMAFLAIGFDLPRAIMAKTEQESALNLARQAEISPAIGIVAKNSDDPGQRIAAELVRSMRTGGYTDKIEVWFYEVPAAELPKTKRVYGYEVILESDLDPFFARVLGSTNIHVASSLVSLSSPYADVAVWRPASVRSGVYAAAADSANINFAAKNLTDMPDALRRELASSSE